MTSIELFLTKHLKLTVNKAKSAVAAPQVRKFLGFSFTSGTNLNQSREWVPRLSAVGGRSILIAKLCANMIRCWPAVSWPANAAPHARRGLSPPRSAARLVRLGAGELDHGPDQWPR